MADLTHGVTTKFTAAERRELQERASDAGLKIGPYIRREVLRSMQMSRETRLVLTSLAQLQELFIRLLIAASQEPLTPALARQIEHAVRSVDPVVFTASVRNGAAR